MFEIFARSDSVIIIKAGGKIQLMSGYSKHLDTQGKLRLKSFWVPVHDWRCGHGLWFWSPGLELCDPS